MTTYTIVRKHEIKDMSIGITFDFSNPLCDILKETIYDNAGNPHHSLKLKPNGYFRDYYYQMGVGLISRDDLTPPLTALSKIKSENDAVEFIEKYGSLFRINENKYIGISVNDVFRAVKRINSLFRL